VEILCRSYFYFQMTLNKLFKQNEILQCGTAAHHVSPKIKQSKTAGDAKVVQLFSALIVILAISSVFFTCATKADELHPADTSVQRNLLDPRMATLYAVLPGSIFHGMGHFYAKDRKTGTVLLLTEVVGIYFWHAAIVKVFSDAYPPKNANLDYGIACFALFGSWLYDIATAAGAVERYNKNISLGIAINKTEGTMIYARIRF